jgi:uncharacterized cupredoxin-like copper-binding protein
MIDALGVYSGVEYSGTAGSVTIQAPPGMYEFSCSIPGHRSMGMYGTLTVQ